MTVRLTDLTRELLMWTPGCPGPVARRELLRSAQRFCRATFAVIEDTGGFVLEAEQGELDLNSYTSAGLIALRAVDVTVEGERATQVTLRAVMARQGDPTDVVPGEIHHYYMLDERTLRLFPYPDTDRTVRLNIAVCPANNATSLPDVFGAQWRDAVVGGAMQAICTVPGQPYTSLDHAAMGAAKFNLGVQQARIDTNRSYGAEVSVAMRPFA